MNINTRIAELLGWNRVYSFVRERSSFESAWAWEREGEVVADYTFTEDLDLTVREIERKGWRFLLAWDITDYDATIYENEAAEAMLAIERADTPAEALALAFLAALEEHHDTD